MDVVVIACVALIVVGVIACVALESRPKESFAEREFMRLADRVMAAADISLDAKRIEYEERARPTPRPEPRNMFDPEPSPDFDGVKVPNVAEFARTNGFPVGE